MHWVELVDFSFILGYISLYMTKWPITEYKLHYSYRYYPSQQMSARKVPTQSRNKACLGTAQHKMCDSITISLTRENGIVSSFANVCCDTLIRKRLLIERVKSP